MIIKIFVDGEVRLAEDGDFDPTTIQWTMGGNAECGAVMGSATLCDGAVHALQSRVFHAQNNCLNPWECKHAVAAKHRIAEAMRYDNALIRLLSGIAPAHEDVVCMCRWPNAAAEDMVN